VHRICTRAVKSAHDVFKLAYQYVYSLFPNRAMQTEKRKSTCKTDHSDVMLIRAAWVIARWRVRLTLPIQDFADQVCSTTTETVDNIIALAFVMLQRRSRSRSDRQKAAVHSVISRRQLQW